MDIIRTFCDGRTERKIYTSADAFCVELRIKTGKHGAAVKQVRITNAI